MKDRYYQHGEIDSLTGLQVATVVDRETGNVIARAVTPETAGLIVAALNHHEKEDGR